MFSKPSLVLLLASQSQAIQMRSLPYEGSLLGLVAQTYRPQDQQNMMYDAAQHMDAFSLDHDKTLDKAGKPIKNVLANQTFGFGKAEIGSFTGQSTSIDAELSRLHQQFDEPTAEAEKPSSMPTFSLFSSHKSEEKKSTDKVDAPVATHEDEKTVTQETTIKIGDDTFKPVTPLELPSLAESNKMRSVLGLEPLQTEGSTSTTKKFEALFDNKTVDGKPLTLLQKLAKAHENNKDLFHSGLTSSFLADKPDQSIAEKPSSDFAIPDTKELDKILGNSKIEKTKSGEEDFATELAKMRGQVVINKTSEADNMKSELAKLRKPAEHKNSVKEMLTGASFTKSIQEMMTGDNKKTQLIQKSI